MYNYLNLVNVMSVLTMYCKKECVVNLVRKLQISNLKRPLSTLKNIKNLLELNLCYFYFLRTSVGSRVT